MLRFEDTILAPALLRRAAEVFDDAPCMTRRQGEGSVTESYRAFVTRLGFLETLFSRDALHGARIVILDIRREYTVYWICAALYFGATAVPLNGKQPKAELLAILRELDAFTIVVPEGELADWRQLLPEQADRLTAAETALTQPPAQVLPAPAEVSPADTAMIVYTSGTTGAQKGAVLSHAALCGNMIPVAKGAVRYEPHLRVYSVLPFYHVLGFTVEVILMFLTGGECVLGEISASYPHQIKAHGCNYASCVPMLTRFVAQMLGQAARSMPGVPPEQVKAALFGEHLHIMTCGGAYLEPEVALYLKTFGIDVITGYGMTECTSHISGDIFRGARPGSIGSINPCLSYKIEDGELFVRGTGVMDGYWRNPEETAKVLRDGWLATGDLGEVDADGYFYFKGRRKNLLIAENGENISPEGVENALTGSLHPKEVRVRLGNGGLHADLVFEQIPEDLDARLRAFNKDYPAFRQIRSYTIYPDALEKNALGKLLRTGLSPQGEVHYI